jgi:hypothetical protein
VGLGWKRQRAAKGSSLRTPAGVRYEVEIPASSIQPHHALEAGLILAFDVAIQHSSRDGRRGIVQWVRGFTHPTDPGGSIRLI